LEDVAIIGVPVYAERVPDIASKFLAQVKGNGRPAIAGCVYGNIDYGIALRELQELCTKSGFEVVAGAAFIARHSFSCPELRVAEDRPDGRDIETARAFGLAVKAKLEKGGTVLPKLPGRLSLAARVVPPKGERWVTHQPVPDNSCRSCGMCVSACPVEAIEPVTLGIKESLCLRCFACVRACPVGARSITLRRKVIVKNYLRLHGHQYRQPETYL